MSDYLQQIIYLTQSDYDILAQGTEENPRSVTKNGITLTNLDENCLYITDGGVVSSDISGVINVLHGGTGNETFLSGQVLVGNGENPITTIIKTSANTGNTLVERDANGDFSASNITMTQGNIGSMTLSDTTIAALTVINTTNGNGLLAYRPSNWTGVSSNQWGVGTVDRQGVIRSSSTDLLHSRNGTNSVILDADNYSSYIKYINLYEARDITTTLNKAAGYVTTGAMFHLVANSNTSATDNGKTPTDANIFQMNWDTSGGYDSQLGIATNKNRMYFRAQPSAKTTWEEVAHAPVGATGVGNSTQPVYMTSEGVVTACTSYANASVNYATSAGKATNDGDDNTITTTYAKLASPALTGTPTAPTAANGTSTTQIATTAFVNNTLAYANAMTFKGTLGTGGTITALPASHNAGDTYRVITAGTWAGKYCEVGTLIICITDGTTATNAHWTSVETNEDGAVIGPATSTDNAIARFDGTTGRIIQNSKTTIDDYGYITLNHTTGRSSEIEVKYDTNIDFWMGIGNANENHGIYDAIASKWVLSAGLDNVWSFNGTALSANTAAALSAAPTITSGGTATVTLSANTAYTLTVGGKSVIFKTPADSNTDTKVNYSLAATTKAYLMASSDAPTSTATAREAKGDTDVYLTTTAGELSAARYSYNVSGTEKAYSYYNTTLNSIDFVFV